MSDFSERTWTSRDGLALAARDYPGAAGPARLPVILIHGLTRNARDFEAVAPVIAAAGRRALAVDVRGRGRSAWDPDPSRYAVPTYVADLEDLARAAGIARAVFIGTSMGGLITMALAARSPELIAAALLNDIGPVIHQAGLERIMSYVGQAPGMETWADAAAHARRTNGHAFPDYRDEDWTAFARRTFREGPDGRPVPDYDPAIAVPFRQTPAGPARDPWASYDRLAEGRPLTLIRGERSDILSDATAAEMGRRAPSLRRTEIPEVGHAPMLTEPAARAAIAAFLAEAP